MFRNPLPLFATFVVTVLAFAPACQAGDDDEQSPATGTLAEVRAAGALRSAYRREIPQTQIGTPPLPDLDGFRREIKPILTASCVPCHGPETQEGEFRVDTLDPNLLQGDDVDWWLEVVGVLSNSEMPPEGEGDLTDGDRARLIEWLSTEIQAASTARRAQREHSSFRRMTRYEYNYALQDLLGLPYNFAGDLPPEPDSEDGFRNSSEMLQMSSIQFAQYRELSRKALLRATVRGERPEPVYWAVSMKGGWDRVWSRHEQNLEKARKKHANNPAALERELKRHNARLRGKPRGAHYRNLTTDESLQAVWGYNGARYAWPPSATRPEPPLTADFVAVIPARQRLIVELGNSVPDRGVLRVRIRACRATVRDDRVPGLALDFGWQASNNSHASVRVSRNDLQIAAPPDQPRFYQWDIPLSEIYPRNPMRKTAKMGATPSPSEYIRLHNTSIAQDDIRIDYVEVTAPAWDQWPPESHTRIFGQRSTAQNETDYARDVLTRFMSRAWRRPVSPAEVDQKLALFGRVRDIAADPQAALVEVLATVLSSPRFLYLAQPSADSESIGDFELATRLAMFLWCSIPDAELLELAAAGTLRQPEVLTAQTERMLADPRSARFAKHFVRQWLGMQLLDFLDVDKKSFPQFDTELRSAMQREPIAFFREVLEHDRSVMDFLHADYSVVNERLARHYGLSNVHGTHFRSVPLSAEAGRGGLLTQAGLLAMNSDGKDSHPLKRGIWMLERLLNDPPPPPPPVVPEIDLTDPEIARLSLKQRIENHRNDPACLSCHARIDPWGIAFENFDAVGKWRTEIGGEPVDAASRLFNGQQLNGMDGLKRFLLSNRQDQFTRAIVHKLATYALGRPLSFGDRAEVERITACLRQQGDGLKTLVTLVVTSPLFQSR